MAIKHRVALSKLALLLVLVSASTAIAQIKRGTQPSPITTTLSDRERLEISKQVEDEVDRAFNNTTTILNILLVVLTVLPIFAAAGVWLLRLSVKNQIQAELNKQTAEVKQDFTKQLQEDVTAELKKQTTDVKQEVEKQLEKEVADEFRKQTAAIRQDIEKQKTELSNLVQETEVEFQKLMITSKQEIEKRTTEFVSKILQLQLKKENIIQQLDLIIPSSTQVGVVPEESVAPEVQQEIEELTSLLTILKVDNPQISFTTNDYLKQGDALFLARRYSEAIEYYERAIKAQSDSYIAWVNRGRALRRLGNYEDALSSYDMGIDIKADYYIAWFGRGNALRNLQRYDEAIYSYEKALELQPDFDLAWYNKARCHALQGEIDFAIEHLHEAINLNPDKYGESSIIISDFDVLRPDERFQKLETLLLNDEAIKLKPSDYLAWFGRGNALKNLERYDYAIYSYEQALDLQPEFDLAWYNKAQCHGLQGDIDLALESLTQAANLNTTSNYLKLAQTDPDFDAIRESDRFQKLIAG
jgi:tetratricopeptide (TPR) repeat protein